MRKLCTINNSAKGRPTDLEIKTITSDR